MRKQQLEFIFYRLAIFATALILIWIGIFKFTTKEAEAIVPLVENHPLMSWLYALFSKQVVSNLIGIAEILIGISSILAIKFRQLGLYAGIGGCVIFTITLSFLFTTPNSWRIIEGVPVCDFFILKDLGYLAISALLTIKSTK